MRGAIWFGFEEIEKVPIKRVEVELLHLAFATQLAPKRPILDQYYLDFGATSVLGTRLKEQPQHLVFDCRQDLYIVRSSH